MWGNKKNIKRRYLGLFHPNIWGPLEQQFKKILWVVFGHKKLNLWWVVVVRKLLLWVVVELKFKDLINTIELKKKTNKMKLKCLHWDRDDQICFNWPFLILQKSEIRVTALVKAATTTWSIGKSWRLGYWHIIFF